MKRKLFSEYGINLIISFAYLVLYVLSIYYHYETCTILSWMGFLAFRIIAEMNKDRR